MKRSTSAAVLAALLVTPVSAGAADSSYLPNDAASRVVSVTKSGTAAAAITVLTEGIATKETGPKKTVAHFGEAYAFAPSFVAVHRDEPTEISFWNLQPDDEHDFMLVAPDRKVLMRVTLAPLQETKYVFTFHEEGLFNFYCTMHQPEMSGQILVLPPLPGAPPALAKTPAKTPG